MAQLACQYLALQATSAPVERLMSVEKFRGIPVQAEELSL